MLQNCRIKGCILVEVYGGQTEQEDDGYIEEETAPRGHYEIGLSYVIEKLICTVVC